MKKHSCCINCEIEITANSSEELMNKVNDISLRGDSIFENLRAWLNNNNYPMTLNEYQALAQRTQNSDAAFDKIHNGTLGLVGEAGEVADLLKKHCHQGHDLPKDRMIEEAGDVLWYIAELAAGLGVTLEEIAQRNIDKLKARYPHGFDPERSINRDTGLKH